MSHQKASNRRRKEQFARKASIRKVPFYKGFSIRKGHFECLLNAWNKAYSIGKKKKRSSSYDQT